LASTGKEPAGSSTAELTNVYRDDISKRSRVMNDEKLKPIENTMKITARNTPAKPGAHPELTGREAKIAHTHGKITPLYQYLLNSAETAQNWKEFLSTVRQRNSLPSDLRELIILRVTVLNHAPNEFATHVEHAQFAGLSDEKIHAVKVSSISPIFTQREQLALELVDVMTQHIDLPEPLFEKISKQFQGKELLDLCIMVGAYNLASRVLMPLQIGH
jgi:alkylhydroperoxidase family enzyme